MKYILTIVLIIITLSVESQDVLRMRIKGRIMKFNSYTPIDTTTPPNTTIACDSVVPCDAVIPCDAVYTSHINSLRINRNNYLDDFYRHEETLIV